MSPTLLLLLAYFAASLSCMGAIVSWLFIRRGGDSDLKGDVHELTILVDRLSKAERRERMSRVRRGEKEGQPGEAFPVPPGAENLTAEAPGPIDKGELRRRVLQMHRGSLK